MATAINDLVCVHIDNSPAFFARVEDIVPDVKPGWWQVKLLILTHPLQVFTWILDESQINGASFTMGGTPVMLELVIVPQMPGPADDDHPVAGAGEGRGGRKPNGKVVSLCDRRKGS